MKNTLKTVLLVAIVAYGVSLFFYLGLSFVLLEWVEWDWYTFRAVLIAGIALGIFGSFIKWLITLNNNDG